MTTIYLGLGSNLGDKEENMSKALAFIREIATITRSSRLYETQPVGEKKQEWFLNAVVEAETDLGPKSLLAALQAIEKKVGRTKTKKNGPRVIDIDILFYDDLVIKTDDITIPHKHLHERLFVLQPFMDINPDFIHPFLNKTIRQLYSLGDWKDQKVRSR